MRTVEQTDFPGSSIVSAIRYAPDHDELEVRLANDTAYLYFDVAFVVVAISLLVQGWSIAVAARRFQVALPRSDRQQRRIELDLPGQLDKELVGYAIAENSPYLRRRLIPSWAKPTLVVRGGTSDLLSPAIVDRMKKAAPAMAYAEVPGVGHAPMLDEPEARAAIFEFLAGVG